MDPQNVIQHQQHQFQMFQQMPHQGFPHSSLQPSMPQQMQQPMPQPIPPHIMNPGPSMYNEQPPVADVDPYILLERKLEQIQETSRHIGVIASDFNQRSQDTLNGKIYALIHGLQDLDKVKNAFGDTKVPLELLNFLDEEKNPQLYTKEILERTLQKNKEVNGKIEIYKKFRAHLLKEFAEEMPDMVMKYRNMRDDMSIGANAVMSIQNASTAKIIKFVPHFLSLRLSWTHNDLKAEGLESFVEDFLPIIRENNPQVNFFLHRSYTTCDPFVVGEYKWLRHRKKRLNWKTKEQVLSMVEEMAIGGDYREGYKRGVNKRLPRGQELWDTETMGHDVFKVYSKWKPDNLEEDELPIVAKTHPHFTYRK